MMKLTTLWSVDQTFSPDGRSPIADQFACRWQHDPGSLRFFRSSANFIYLLQRDGERSFLRAASSQERSREQIAHELNILEELRQAGIPVVQTIPSLAGNALETIETVIGTFHVVLFAGLAGTQRVVGDLTPEDFGRWGAAIGRVHAALATVPPEFNIKHPSWEHCLNRIDSRSAELPSSVTLEAARLRPLLLELPQTNETYGLLHGDLELDNLIWRDEDIAALDFDEYSAGWYMFDLAKALSEPLEEGHTLESPELSAFVDGYRQEHSLSDESLAMLPDFISLSDLNGYASLARAIDIAVDEAPVDWMQDLIVRLRAWMSAYEERCAARLAVTFS